MNLFLLKITGVKSHVKWLLIIFSVKITLFIFFCFQFNRNYPDSLIINKIFVYSGETQTYYMPLENLANGYGYSEGQLFPSLTRMPGLLPLYLPLFKIAGNEYARSAMIIIQFIISCFSVYILAIIAGKLFNSRFTFILTLFLFSISTFVSIFDHIGLAESLGVSFLIFSVYFMLRYTEGYGNLVLSGVFMCWSIFLRPAHGIILPVLCIFYVFALCRIGSFKRITLGIILFMLPLIIFISIWGIRNYKVTGGLLFLEKGGPAYVYSPQFQAIWKLIGAWGGKIAPWEVNSEGEWFFSKSEKSSFIFSERHFTPDFTMDSLLQLRNFYRSSMDENLTEAERNDYAKKVVAAAAAYKESYKNHKPLHYYFLSPALLAGNFLILKTTNYLPFPALPQMNLFQKILKVFYIFLYNLMLALGFIGIVLSFFKNSSGAGIIALFPLAYAFVITIILLRSEERYLVPLYPFFVMFSSFAVEYIIKNIYTRLRLINPSNAGIGKL